MDSNLISSIVIPPGLPFAERRHEPRFETAQFASVTQLTGAPEPLPANVLEVSTRGIKLKLAQSLPVGAPLKIDVRSDLILGEVRYWTPEEDGSYCVGVEIDQIFTNARDVARRWSEAGF